MTNRTINISSIAIACAALLGCSSQSRVPTELRAVNERVVDRAIFQDIRRYDAQQARIKALNDSGKHRIAGYSLSKAQCWLDVSLHEYSRNDRGGFPSDSIRESSKITDYLETGAALAAPINPANATPLVNQAVKLRPDLWAEAEKLKSHPGWRCAEQKVACAEVELVHAGNEFNQQEWRYAKPYVQMAEDMIEDAQRLAQACVPPPAPVAVVTPPPPVPAPPPVIAPPVPTPAPIPVNLVANVLFNFDKRSIDQVRPYTKDQLDALIAQVKSSALRIANIRLIGHADRLIYAGQPNYNNQLSMDRVQSIRAYMVSQGVDAAMVTAEYKSDSQQIEACDLQKFRSNAELQECLLPNRRVEVIVSGFKR